MGQGTKDGEDAEARVDGSGAVADGDYHRVSGGDIRGTLLIHFQ